MYEISPARFLRRGNFALRLAVEDRLGRGPYMPGAHSLLTRVSMIYCFAQSLSYVVILVSFL